MTTLRLDPFQETRQPSASDRRSPQQKNLGPVWYVADEKQDLDTDVKEVVLDIVKNTKKMRDLDITQVVTDGEIEESMDGASNIRFTIHDPDRELLNTGALDRAVDVNLNGLYYRLVALEKNGSFLTLTFEDRVVAYLKSHNKVLRMNRGRMTRLEFCLYLIRQVKKGQTLVYDDHIVNYNGIPCVIPELHIKPTFEQLSRDDKSSLELTRSNNRESGLPDDHQFVIYNADGSASDSTPRQNRMMEDALDAGVSMDGMVQKVLVSAIAVMMIETGVKNLSQEQSDSDSQGPFQQRPSQGWPDSRSTKTQARAYYKAALDVYKGDHSLTAGEIAAQVQRPKASLRDRYAHAQKYAQRVVDSYSGESITSRTYRKKYIFSTEDNGKSQNYWDAIGRLMDELQYARFMSNGYLYLISETQLFKSKSRMTLSEKTPGIDAIDFNWDTGKEDASATITCRIQRWAAPPGTCVTLQGCGPANGKWLVGDIRRNLYSRDATITLRKPRPLLPEPSPGVSTVDLADTTASGFENSLGLPTFIAAMYRAAKRISDRHYPYVWGGGHARAGIPDRGDGSDPGIGYDCSGSTAALFVAGGKMRKGTSVTVSNLLPGSVGMVSGPGKYFTVWANVEHVFVEFYLHGKHDDKHSIHFGTGNWGKGWNGPGINQNLHPHAGFSPYHFSEDTPTRARSNSQYPSIQGHPENF